MEDNPLWKMNFDGRGPLIEDNFLLNTTFEGRQPLPLMGDNLWWKATFDERHPLMEDDLWWKTISDRRHPLTFDGRQHMKLCANLSNVLIWHFGGYYYWAWLGWIWWHTMSNSCQTKVQYRLRSCSGGIRVGCYNFNMHYCTISLWKNITDSYNSPSPG